MSRRDKTLQELVPHNMTINLQMLCSFMENRVLRNVKCCHIVTIEWNRGRKNYLKIMKQVGNPLQLSYSAPHCPVLCFSKGS